jgi:glycosyltransferase involved in cell wall biosynthesis
VNVFFEAVDPLQLGRARVNCLVPNPEWFRQRWRPYLAALDLVLCKTRMADAVFSALGCRTAVTGFTSVDRLEPGAAMDYGRFFHLAGRSVLKGTDTLVALWARHPEWPMLTVIQHPANASRVRAANVAYRCEYLDDAVLRREQNAHGVHLCPSEAEGFGHYIVEALSCRAVVVTTDAPPMNEHVTRDRGLLAGCTVAGAHHLGTRYAVDPASLERGIEQVLATDAAAKRRLGDHARAWYEDSARAFRRRLVEVLRDV